MNRRDIQKEIKKTLIQDEQNEIIQFSAMHSLDNVFHQFHTTINGLKEENVEKNRDIYGMNEISEGHQKSFIQNLLDAFINPFTLILCFLALVSTITDMIFPYLELFGNTKNDFDCLTFIIIVTMILVSGILRFIQESRSGEAAEKLLKMITTTCTVTRQGKKQEIPMDDLVVGDIVYLSAGDMIPGDMRLIETKDLFVSQASLTGESEPIEKNYSIVDKKQALTDYINIVFMGSNVISGSGCGVVIRVGNHTMLGMMASTLTDETIETSFTKGVNEVSWVLIHFMMVMVPLVFIINGLTKHNWLSAFLFAISIAVGLTPEMLPMIVTTCLSKGAISMSKKIPL